MQQPVKFPKVFGKNRRWKKQKNGDYKTIIHLKTDGVGLEVTWNPESPYIIHWVEITTKVMYGNSGLDDIKDFQKGWEKEIRR